ncbi:hypothetical protein Taro_041523, partial [Colocasia esculenta]|nr:hypothetical protein [Colocasia esculenta]
LEKELKHLSKEQIQQKSAVEENLKATQKQLKQSIAYAVGIFTICGLFFLIIFIPFLQVISWGTLALIPITGNTFPTQMACILLGNLGASFTEVVSDALVAEFSKAQKEGMLQSYAFMALAAGGILGNLSGGIVLLRSQQPKVMFLTFALLLIVQLGLSLTAREDTFNLPSNSNLCRRHYSVSESLSKQFSNLITIVNEETLYHPLSWIVASIAVVPLLSGTIFCFQTHCLKLDPAVIGLSKVIGQLMVLSATFVYNHYMKRIHFRKLVFWLQIIYALSLLSDLCLVNQINIKLGISNEAFVLCLSALAEAVAQFKILPFSVLFASLCPPGYEGSLFAFFASALCLSSILGGIFGVGLASLIGVTSGDYSRLSVGIILQFVAALIPLGWISYLPAMQTSGKVIKRSKKGLGMG